jgi:hypothetical protein
MMSQNRWWLAPSHIQPGLHSRSPGLCCACQLRARQWLRLLSWRRANFWKRESNKRTTGSWSSGWPYGRPASCWEVLARATTSGSQSQLCSRGYCFRKSRFIMRLARKGRWKMEKKGSEGTGRECLSSSRVTFGRSSLSARRIMLVPWWLLFFLWPEGGRRHHTRARRNWRTLRT